MNRSCTWEGEAVRRITHFFRPTYIIPSKLASLGTSVKREKNEKEDEEEENEEKKKRKKKKKWKEKRKKKTNLRLPYQTLMKHLYNIRTWLHWKKDSSKNLVS